MSRTVLIMGVDKPLGGLLAAYLLATGQETVLVEDPPRAQERIDEVWSFGPTQGLTLNPSHEPQPDALHRLLAQLRGCPIGVFNHVSTAYVAGSKRGTIQEEPFDERYPVNTPAEGSERTAEREVVTWCREAGIPWRIFRPSMLFGVPLARGSSSPGGLHGFLATLFRFKELIDSKSSDHFQKHPLRLATAPGASPNIIRVERAVEWMLQIARNPALVNDYFHIVSSETDSLERVGQHIEAITRLKLEWVDDSAVTDPVDLLLRARAAAFDCYLTQPKHFDSTRARQAAPGYSSLRTWETQDEQRLIESIHQQWASSRQEARHEVARALGTLARRTINSEDGSPIEYQVAGSGPVLVCVNAMGQSLSIWSWAIAHFLKSHRIIYWSPRGTYGSLSRRLTIKDQVADLELILKREGVQQCRLIAWCSGAKVGLELLSRSSVASSLVLVTGDYAPLKGLEHLETTFHHAFQRMCQMVSQQQEMAALVRVSMESMVLNHQPRHAGTAQGSPADVLALASRELRAAIIEPFSDVQSICNYSFQVVDYASHDIAATLDKVTTPTLLIDGELDQVVSPEMSRAVSERLPVAHYAEIRGGTHYCLHENAELVIDLIERFFESPRTFCPTSPELVRTRLASPR